MICVFCMSAGQANSDNNQAEAERLHRLCYEPDCFCQHAVGKGWIADAVNTQHG